MLMAETPRTVCRTMMTELGMALMVMIVTVIVVVMMISVVVVRRNSGLSEGMPSTYLDLTVRVVIVVPLSLVEMDRRV